MPCRRPKVACQPCTRFFVLVLLLVLDPLPSRADDKKPEEKKPTALVCLPLGLAPGASAAKVRVRGLMVDETTEIKFQNTPVTAKIVTKTKVGVPDKQKAERVGDTEVGLEVTVPPETPKGEVNFTLVTPKGETAPHALLIGPANLVQKKEPNGGFREAQPVELGQTIEGAMEQGRDVDVFRVHGAAGTRLVAEVIAARYGSAFDGRLTLYNSQGHILAASDDSPVGPGGALSADALLEFTLPAEGDYFLALVDAQDTAGPAHVYRLRVGTK